MRLIYEKLELTHLCLQLFVLGIVIMKMNDILIGLKYHFIK